MSNMIGNKIKIQIFGQSHSESIGVVIDSLPCGFAPDMDRIEHFLNRRKGGNDISTKRAESDKPIIVSGLSDGYTCMAPLCALFENNDTRSRDYSSFKTTPRPSHADYTALIKASGFNDIRGGGTFSGRLTLPLCFAGAVFLQLLEQKGIYIGAHISRIAAICDTPFDPVNVTKSDFEDYTNGDRFPLNNKNLEKAMRNEILEAARAKDSVGGIIECAIVGLECGVGEPMFDGIENAISSVVFGIPGVKGVEFGSGFGCADMRGSAHNDPFIFDKNRDVKTQTNNSGGINGGISNGMPIIFRVAIKPTPSIAAPQKTVNLSTGEESDIIISGRHDPCIVPRAVPCVEAAAAIAVLNLL